MQTSPTSNDRRILALRLLTSTALVASLAAGCGGRPEEPTAPAPAADDAAVLTITGTAATGAALSGAALSARCAVGVGNTTSENDGSFSFTIRGGALPCVLRADAPTGPLVSVAAGTGASAVANVTPLTHLVLAQATRQEPIAYYDLFDAAAAAALAPGAISIAQAVLRTLLGAAGIPLGGVVDWLTGALSARTSSNPGDAYDQALDAFVLALARGGTSLAAFTSAVAQQAAPPATTSVPIALPADLLLKPAAATCAALRSGTYRMLTPVPGAALPSQFGVATIDAQALLIARADGSQGTWAPTGPCRFSEAGGGWNADIAVSQAGVIVGRYTLDGGLTWRPIVGVPMKSHALVDLEGTWNTMGLARGTGGFTGVSGVASLNATGAITAQSNCRNDSTWAIDACAPVAAASLPALATMSANADGGFDVVDMGTRAITGRVFGYRAGSGHLMLIEVSEDGLSFWAPQLAVPLPAIGTVSFNLNFNTNSSMLSASSTEATTNTVTAWDTAAASWTRTQATVGAPFNYVTSLFANRPRAGNTFRSAGRVTASNGTTVVILNEFTTQRMPGMGFSPLIIPAPKLLQLSVGVPAPQ